MTTLRSARPADLPRLRTLWQTAFGDGDALIHDFLTRRCPLDRVLVLCEGDVPGAMLALLPMELKGEAGPLSLPYVYALCTHPALRGRGYARRLLDYAAHRAEEEAPGISTVPAEASLHRFFASAGYGEAFQTQIWRAGRGELPAPRAGDGLTPVTAGEYNALRAQLLQTIPHQLWPEGWTDFQRDLSQQSGAGLYRLTAGGRPGCAAVELGEDRVIGKELLAAPGALPAAGGVLAEAFPAEEYELRFPADPAAPGRAVPFGMVRPLGGWTPPKGAYLGLAFD